MEPPTAPATTTLTRMCFRRIFFSLSLFLLRSCGSGRCGLPLIHGTLPIGRMDITSYPRGRREDDKLYLIPTARPYDRPAKQFLEHLAFLQVVCPERVPAGFGGGQQISRGYTGGLPRPLPVEGEAGVGHANASRHPYLNNRVKDQRGVIDGSNGLSTSAPKP